MAILTILIHFNNTNSFFFVFTVDFLINFYWSIVALTILILEWSEIFKVLREKNLQSRTQGPAKLSFRNEGEIKTFSEKLKLREFVANRPALQEMLKEVFLENR